MTVATAAGIVNSQGQTFAVIEGPVEFDMGSPPTEWARFTALSLYTGYRSPSVSPSPPRR